MALVQPARGWVSGRYRSRAGGTDKSLSLKDGAIKNPEWEPKDVGGYLWQMIEALAVNIDSAWIPLLRNINKQQQNAICLEPKARKLQSIT
jgi:hypothetical protein